MPTVYELTFDFDRRFIRDGLKRDVAWRAVGFTLVLVSVGIAATAVHGVHRQGLLVLGMGTAVLLALIRYRLGSAVERIYQLWTKQSPSGTIRYRLDDDALEVALDHSRSRFQWRDLRRLRRYPDVWLLEVVEHRNLMFPVGAAPDEVSEFLVERCRGAGVRV